jgi:hypothetical protein
MVLKSYLKIGFVEMPKFNKTETELKTYLDRLEDIPAIFNKDSEIKEAFEKAKFVNMSKEKIAETLNISVEIVEKFL